MTNHLVSLWLILRIWPIRLQRATYEPFTLSYDKRPTPSYYQLLEQSLSALILSFQTRLNLAGPSFPSLSSISYCCLIEPGPCLSTNLIYHPQRQMKRCCAVLCCCEQKTAAGYLMYIEIKYPRVLALPFSEMRRNSDEKKTTYLLIIPSPWAQYRGSNVLVDLNLNIRPNLNFPTIYGTYIYHVHRVLLCALRREDDPFIPKK